MNRAQRRQKQRVAPAVKAFGKRPTGTVAAGYVYPAESISPPFKHSWDRLLNNDDGLLVDTGPYQSSANISWGRNQIVRWFLAHEAKPDWLWLVDTDMTFGPDIVRQLVDAADPVERPIVGALCFGVRPFAEMDVLWSHPIEVFPTLYMLDADGGGFRHYLDYPADELVPVDATGAGCILIHRNVFDAIPDDQPMPWFRESTWNGRYLSEDTTFCVLARNAGFPTHVHTGIKTGHVKQFVASEWEYWHQPRKLAAAVCDDCRARIFPWV